MPRNSREQLGRILAQYFCEFIALKHGFGGECYSTYAEAYPLLLLLVKELYNFDILLDVRTKFWVKRLQQFVT